MDTKTCLCCKETKSVAEFHKKTGGGFQARCKACRKINTKHVGKQAVKNINDNKKLMEAVLQNAPSFETIKSLLNKLRNISLSMAITTLQVVADKYPTKYEELALLLLSKSSIKDQDQDQDQDQPIKSYKQLQSRFEKDEPIQIRTITHYPIEGGKKDTCKQKCLQSNYQREF